MADFINSALIAVTFGFVGLFAGYHWGEATGDRTACLNYGKLTHLHTQLRDGECMFRKGDGWVWLSEMVREK